jgi:hypothetical protein
MSITQLTPIMAICIMIAVGVAYFVFLAATWNQFQSDRRMRDTKLDELLDRLPKKVQEPPLPDGI